MDLRHSCCSYQKFLPRRERKRDGGHRQGREMGRGCGGSKFLPSPPPLQHLWPLSTSPCSIGARQPYLSGLGLSLAASLKDHGAHQPVNHRGGEGHSLVGRGKQIRKMNKKKQGGGEKKETHVRSPWGAQSIFCLTGRGVVHYTVHARGWELILRRTKNNQWGYMWVGR